MKPTIPQVMPLVRNYLEKHPAGGSLHIVLDDGNVEDNHVEFCYRFAMHDRDLYVDHPAGVPVYFNDPPDLEGAALALILLAMSKTQRRKIYRTA